jgi:hypothetical protein
MTYMESILKVLVVGLLLGAGLPAVFASGLVAYSRGGSASGGGMDGAAYAPNPALRILGLLLFAFVAAVIVVAILWITRTTIIHHFGVDPFPFIHTK